jgi:hypothetical protein
MFTSLSFQAVKGRGSPRASVSQSRRQGVEGTPHEGRLELVGGWMGIVVHTSEGGIDREICPAFCEHVDCIDNVAREGVGSATEFELLI